MFAQTCLSQYLGLLLNIKGLDTLVGSSAVLVRRKSLGSATIAASA